MFRISATCRPLAHAVRRRRAFIAPAIVRCRLLTVLSMLAPAAVLATSVAGPASTTAPDPTRTPLSDVVSRLERDGFAGVIAFVDGTGDRVEFATGDADREAHRPHRADQRWLWASVTKQVTATLVMRRVETGQLGLDDTIASRLPRFGGATGSRITVRQLLQHTSGLPNPDDDATVAEGEVPRFYRDRGTGIGDTARALGFCAGTPLAEPGAKFAYDNCDYLVLGAILEAVGGKPYATLVDEEIARPIGATTLAIAPDGAAYGGTDVVGYLDGARRYPTMNVATFGAGGALVGTARDLLAFDQAAMTHRLLGPTSTDVLWTGDPRLGYEALGVWSFSTRLRGCAVDVHLVERRGDVAGIQVRNLIAPGLGAALVVFTNDASVDFGEIWQGRGTTFDLASAAFCGH